MTPRAKLRTELIAISAYIRKIQWEHGLWDDTLVPSNYANYMFETKWQRDSML